MMYQGGWFGMGFGWLFWIILIVAVVLLVVWLVGRAPRGRSRPSGAESAEEILKQRYARGEIDRDEYHRRLTDLRR